MKKYAAVIGSAAGVLLAPVGLFMALVSAGTGHGHYIAAKLWFPFTMASTYLLESITPPFMILAVVQYPAYGWLVGRALAEKKRMAAVLIVGSVHVALAAILLIEPPPFFK